jgi:hypothetical protein
MGEKVSAEGRGSEEKPPAMLRTWLTCGQHSEKWRYTGLFSRWNRFKGGFPGLGIATVAFAAYCGYEYMFLKDEHHGEGHGEAHH